MKEAMSKVDGNDGMSFRVPRTRGGQVPDQMTLWSGSAAPQDELLNLVTQRLEAGQDRFGRLFICKNAADGRPMPMVRVTFSARSIPGGRSGLPEAWP